MKYSFKTFLIGKSPIDLIGVHNCILLSESAYNAKPVSNPGKHATTAAATSTFFSSPPTTTSYAPACPHPRASRIARRRTAAASLGSVGNKTATPGSCHASAPPVGSTERDWNTARGAGAGDDDDASRARSRACLSALTASSVRFPIGL
eukprot:26193-Pelagococcus_subviridis.AAC.3